MTLQKLCVYSLTVKSNANVEDILKVMKSNYIKPERIDLKNHPDYNEKWVQKKIEKDPSIIGLGDLELKDSERSQPKAGRLDLLLQNLDGNRRYETEIQLGAVDETHIIRTIEYWDIERRRYPQYDHCAVIIAENITSRFLNVISLFNGNIPLIAIQMQAMKVGDNITLIFTTVLDEMPRGLVDSDEDALSAPTDRAYWEDKATKLTVELADNILALSKDFASNLKIKYNKYYIGIEKDGQPLNFIVFKPRKNQINMEIKMPRTADIDKEIEDNGMNLEYDRGGSYRLILRHQDIIDKSEIIKKLMKTAYEKRLNS